jgi:hypothetical protein
MAWVLVICTSTLLCEDSVASTTQEKGSTLPAKQQLVLSWLIILVLSGLQTTAGSVGTCHSMPCLHLEPVLEEIRGERG